MLWFSIMAHSGFCLNRHEVGPVQSTPPQRSRHLNRLGPEGHNNSFLPSWGEMRIDSLSLAFFSTAHNVAVHTPVHLCAPVGLSLWVTGLHVLCWKGVHLKCFRRCQVSLQNICTTSRPPCPRHRMQLPLSPHAQEMINGEKYFLRCFQRPREPRLLCTCSFLMTQQPASAVVSWETLQERLSFPRVWLFKSFEVGRSSPPQTLLPQPLPGGLCALKVYPTAPSTLCSAPLSLELLEFSLQNSLTAGWMYTWERGRTSHTETPALSRAVCIESLITFRVWCLLRCELVSYPCCNKSLHT